MKIRCMSILSIVMLTLFTALTSPNVLVASATPPLKTLTGYIPSAISSGQARLIGQHPGTDQLSLAIGLPLRNEQALKALLNAVSTPHNPRYLHYLTQTQANQAFNPTPQQEQQVTSWLESHGLTVTHRYPNHLLVDVTGTFAQIEQLFHVTINDYTMQLDGKQIPFYAPANAPIVDDSVKIVINTILGLDDYPSVQVDTVPSIPAHPAGNGNANGSPPYYPQDFANAYDVNPLWNAGYTGVGQNIGITLWSPPPSSAALQQFDAQTGAQPTNLQTFLVDGGSKHSTGATLEAGMDVEYTSGIAPDATINYYELPDTKQGNPTNNGLDDALNMAGTDANNQQISNSWYECEPTQKNAFITETEQILLSNTATGHDYFFSSGDQGSKCGGKNPLATYPGTSDYATSVGGTHFSSNIDGKYRQETAWSGSGGGYSILFPEPSWQTNASIPDTSNMRGGPDVAADADPATGAYICYDGDSGPICTNPGFIGNGTSLATPLWAGMIADVDQYVQSQNELPLGFINPLLYVMNTGMPHIAYHDIKKGKNGKYSTGQGWDAITGLGSPDLYNLAQDAASLDPSNGTLLYGVAAISDTDVWAVGSFINRVGDNQALIEQWNGNAWNIVPSPNLLASSLSSVAVVSATDVWAVGSYDGQTLIEQWNGSTWNVVPSPTLGSYSFLTSVAAVSATNVWAVGSYLGSYDNYYPLIEQWNGSTWNVVPSPSPGSGYMNTLSSVAAVSATDVWAVGSYQDSSQITYALIEQWNGSTWNVVPSPNSQDIVLTSAVAVSATDIWTVGNGSTGDSGTQIERWNGTSWNVVSNPNPGIEVGLFGVAAVSATDAWAVGLYGGSSYQTLTEQWDGTSWNVVSSPNPSLYYDELMSVAAVSATDVWTVGYYIDSNSNYYPLIEQWNGSTWNVVPSPDPNVNTAWKR